MNGFYDDIVHEIESITTSPLHMSQYGIHTFVAMETGTYGVFIGETLVLFCRDGYSYLQCYHKISNTASLTVMGY